jgi:hypothetical protein
MKPNRNDARNDESYMHPMRVVRKICAYIDMVVLSHACCCWIEGGVTVTGGEAVWDVSVFRHLLQRYPTSKVSGAGQEMMVEAASSMSMCSPVETKESDWAMLTRACVVSFLKVVDRSSALGMKIPKSTPMSGFVTIGACALFPS